MDYLTSLMEERQYLLYFRERPTAKPWPLSQQGAKRPWRQTEAQGLPGQRRQRDQGETCP